MWYISTLVLLLGPPLVVMVTIRSTILKELAIVHISTNTVVGLTSGRVIFRSIVKGEAPSISAAS